MKTSWFKIDLILRFVCQFQIALLVFVKLKTSFVQIDCGFLNEFELEFDVLNDNRWLIAKFMNFGDK